MMSEKKTVLVIDTALEGCGVGVWHNHQGFALYNDESNGQAQRLVPMVQDVLVQAQVGFDDVTDILVVIGPGTFTGIRIGLSTAKSLGLALDIPVSGISSLQAIALSAVEKSSVDREGDSYVALVETRRQDFYVQRFDTSGGALSDAQSLLADDVQTIIQDDDVLIGNAVGRLMGLVEGKGKVYTALPVTNIDVEKLGELFSEGALDDVLVQGDAVSPIYLRAPDVSQPKKKFRTLEGASSL